MKNNKGFTLIELLVVIAIIGILASVILASVDSARKKALKARTQEEMLQVVQAVSAAHAATGLPLGQITGSYCTACGVPKATALQTALTNLANASGFQGVQNIITDPYGQVYNLDENEGEGGPTNCTRDSFSSNGASLNYFMPYATPYCQQHPVGTEGFQ